MIICPVQGAGIRRPDAYTVLHLRFDTESNKFFDLCGKTITVSGGATQSTTQRRFVGKAGYFDGNGDYIDTPSTVTDFQFGTGNFSISVWAYPTAVSGYDVINIYNTNSGVKSFVISINNNGYVAAMSYDASGNTIGNITGSVSVVNSWTHIEYNRGGNTFYLFVNGVLIGTATSSAALKTGDANSPVRLGAQRGVSSWYYYTGYIDECMVSKGICRHTSNFTPPTRRV